MEKTIIFKTKREAVKLSFSSDYYFIGIDGTKDKTDIVIRSEIAEIRIPYSYDDFTKLEKIDQDNLDVLKRTNEIIDKVCKFIDDNTNDELVIQEDSRFKYTFRIYKILKS